MVSINPTFYKIQIHLPAQSFNNTIFHSFSLFSKKQKRYSYFGRYIYEEICYFTLYSLDIGRQFINWPKFYCVSYKSSSFTSKCLAIFCKNRRRNFFINIIDQWINLYRPIYICQSLITLINVYVGMILQS